MSRGDGSTRINLISEKWGEQAGEKVGEALGDAIVADGEEIGEVELRGEDADEGDDDGRRRLGGDELREEAVSESSDEGTSANKKAHLHGEYIACYPVGDLDPEDLPVKAGGDEPTRLKAAERRGVGESAFPSFGGSEQGSD